jgi:hypothetical protein
MASLTRRRGMNQESKAVAEAGRRKVIYTLVPRSSLFAGREEEGERL